MRWPIALGIAGLSATLGCQPTTQAPPSVEPEPSTPVSAEPPPSCAGQGERFVDYGFVGADVRAAASLDLTSPDLEASVAALSTRARDADHGWPIAFAFSAGQWSWQVPLLRSTLASAGFAPDELVYVAFEDGSSLWAWSSSCDLRTATAAVDHAWGLSLRPTAYGALAGVGHEDGEPTFPYDVVVFGSEFFGFAPAGRGHAVAQHMAASRRGEPASRLGTDLAAIEASPVRAVMPNLALLGSGAEPGSAERLKIRAGPQGVADAIAPGNAPAG